MGHWQWQERKKFGAAVEATESPACYIQSTRGGGCNRIHSGRGVPEVLPALAGRRRTPVASLQVPVGSWSGILVTLKFDARHSTELHGGSGHIPATLQIPDASVLGTDVHIPDSAADEFHPSSRSSPRRPAHSKQLPTSPGSSFPSSSSAPTGWERNYRSASSTTTGSQIPYIVQHESTHRF